MAGDRRPSVLMTADTVGGVWTYAVELSRALAARGLQVHLATMGAPVQPHQREMLGDGGGVQLHESRFALEWMPQPWRQVDAAGRWLLELESMLRPDFIHLNQFAFGALPFRAPRLVVGHSCVLSWWRAVHGSDAPADWNTYRDRVKAGLQGADLVAAPTRSMLQSLQQLYGVDGIVLPNGRDPALFRPAAKRPFVFAAGRFWDEAKNLAALQAVAPELHWPVCVAGSCTGPDGNEARPTGVQFLGTLPATEVARQMAQASIYALPARYEPFGLSALEAGLAGCALVLGDIPSLRETWNGAAAFVPPGDAEALRAVLQRLVDRPDERSRLAAAAHRRARQYTPQAMANAWFSACARLAPALVAPRVEEASCA
jgi:glycosyltransferase involved in cell wall biosynthesis